ncbi:two-component system response regulator [Geopsychrobacter electrodiphilus]|uniref:two-component system response regulator n=1 Tax=Geopsychrobacter electrodiphilus TaxID=225196 RepID=UPI00037C5EBC|nr:EAL domain-containing protein [Geopsychrobacter electrodiphilus]
MIQDPKKPVILVVDDDLTMQLSLRGALEQAGFSTLIRGDGKSALKAFTELRPDLLLLDVMMPGMDGFETCRALRQLPGGEHTPVLMMTGLDDIAAIHHAFEAGATDFISKPLNWAMLGYRVRYLLRSGKVFQDLQQSQLQLAKAQQLAKLGNWEWDPPTRSIKGSAECFRLLGLDNQDAQLAFKEVFRYIPVAEQELVRVTIEDALAEQKPFTLNHRVVLTNGEERNLLNQGEVVFSEVGNRSIVRGIIQDVTRIREAEEQIRHLAFYDGLTGLANRQLFSDRLQNALATGRRSERLMALLFLDLDRFKRINDTLGHHLGDLLLKTVSERIETCIRDTDSLGRFYLDETNTCVSRLGGDEFLVLLSELANPEDAARVARRILKAISEPLQLGGHEVFVTTSIGISLFPEDGQDAELLLKNADIAMYDAKDKGRNSFQFYKAELNNVATERLALENELRKAMERDEFVLFYQPQFNVESGRIVGAEALIRWQHPTRGLLNPGDFIAIAEDAGLMTPLSEWVVQKACHQNRAWQNLGLPAIRVSINLSGQQFSLPSSRTKVLEMVENSLKNSRLDPQYLEIELTESMLMENTEDTRLILQQLKKVGVSIAIDDFGTGYSSLAYLKAFPIDTLKIDCSFVRDITTSTDSAAITRAIISMANHLELKVIAEGVETNEQLGFLQQLSCQEYQGYLRSRPLPADEFLELFRQEGFR